MDGLFLNYLQTNFPSTERKKKKSIPDLQVCFDCSEIMAETKRESLHKYSEKNCEQQHTNRIRHKLVIPDQNTLQSSKNVFSN